MSTRLRWVPRALALAAALGVAVAATPGPSAATPVGAVVRPVVGASFSVDPATGDLADANWTATLTLSHALRAGRLAVILPSLVGGAPAFRVPPRVPAADVTVDGLPATKVAVLPVTTPATAKLAAPTAAIPSSLPALRVARLPADLVRATPLAIVIGFKAPAAAGALASSDAAQSITITLHALPGSANPPQGTYPVAVGALWLGHWRVADTSVTLAAPSSGPTSQVIIHPPGGGTGGGSGGGGTGSVSFGAQLGPVGGSAYASTNLYTTSSTPCGSLFGVTVCSGANGYASGQDAGDGMVSVGAWATGIATQLAQNSISGSIGLPNTTGATNAMDTFSATIHVYTDLASTSVGFLSNVSLSTFQVSEASPCDSQVASPTVSTSAVIGLPDNPSNIASYLEDAEGPLQNAVEAATSGESLQSILDSAAGAQLITTTFNLTCSLPAGDSAPFVVSPELIVGNAGIGGVGAYAVSYVQVTMNGTETPNLTPTTVTVTPSTGSISFDQPLGLTVGVSPNPGDGTIVYIQYPTTIGPIDSACMLSGGTCSAGITPYNLPTGTDGITAWWNGDANDQGSSGTATVNVSQGTSSTTLSIGGQPAVGQDLTLNAGVTGVGDLLTDSSGTVTFYDGSGDVLGTCSPGYGTGHCTVTWAPPTSGPYGVQAVWSGDLYLAGSASAVDSFTVYPAGPSLSVSASPLRIGEETVCSYDAYYKIVICHNQSLGDAATLTATVLDNGIAASGQTVRFSSSPGGQSLSPGSCTTGSGGQCSVTFRVTQPPSRATAYTLTAASDGQSASLGVTYDVATQSAVPRSAVGR